MLNVPFGSVVFSEATEDAFAAGKEPSSSV
jgi:hypothetical protein